MLEKHAYALVKDLKAFEVYILHTQIIVYVPSSVVREILVQPDIDGKRSKWVIDYQTNEDRKSVV